MIDWIMTFLNAIQHNPLIAGIFGTTVLAGIGVYFKELPKKFFNFIFNFFTIQMVFDQQNKLGTLEGFNSNNDAYQFLLTRLQSLKKFTFSKVEDCVVDDEITHFVGSLNVLYFSVLDGCIISYKVNEVDNKMKRTFMLSVRFFTRNLNKVKSTIQSIIEAEKINKENKEENNFFFNFGNGWCECNKQFQFSQNPLMLNEQQQDIYKKVALFLNNEPKYRKFGKSYHTGFIFHGYPGCGKSQFIKKMAEEFKLPIYILNLACTISDASLINLIQDISSHHVIVLMEDIDRFSFQGELRKTPSKKEQDKDNFGHVLTYDNEEIERDYEAPQFLSFSTILNVLDGIYAPDNGMIFIATTNHFDKLDPAFIRAGRFDHHYLFGYMDKKEICNFLSIQFDYTGSEKLQLRDDIQLSIANVAQKCFESSSIQECVKKLNALPNGSED